MSNNNYQRGYDDGFADAAAGRGTNPRSSNGYYFQGYIEGYARGEAMRLRSAAQ